MDKYHADYSTERRKWCVWKDLTASMREFVQECEDKGKAEKLADKLNKEGEG